MLGRIKTVALGLAVLVGMLANVSYADWGVGVNFGDHHDHGYYGWHDHPHWGYHAHYLPDGCGGIWAGGIKYYYCGGVYYSYAGPGDYVLVNPPVDAYVTTIPPDFQPMNVNGATYYTSDGVYYVLTPHGYRVVSAPMVMAEPVPVAQPAPVVEEDSFPVNVPNDNGSYTAVVLRRSGNGYMGPQGEFYASFPSVAQLKAMYGHK